MKDAPSPPASTQTLREINRSLVLSTIHSQGPITRADVARVSRLSVPTVANLVRGLLEEELVVETGLQESGGGRPSALLEINHENLFLIGVELGETGITTLVTNTGLEEKALRITAIDEGENRPDAIISAIATSVRSALSEANVHAGKVLGIGIGIPGLVDSDKGISVFAPNWGWHDVDVKARVEAALGITTYVDNGAKVMVLGERWCGAGQGSDNVIALIVGTGLGAGVTIDGRIFRGATESAAEWGHMRINIDGPRCSCGSNGCLEAYCGAHAIARRARESLAATPEGSALKKIGDLDHLTASDVIAAAMSGDRLALRLLEETGEYLGAGIANLVNLFNPEVVIIGGWVGIEAGEIMLPAIKVAVKESALEFPLRSTRIVISELADRAIVIGAATVVLDKFLQPPKIRSVVSL